MKKAIILIILTIFSLLNFAFAEVYLSAEEALKNIFPSLKEYKSEERIIDGQEITIFSIFKDGEIIGRAVKLSEMGKNNPITFLVGIDSQKKVLAVHILEFWDMFGSEIKRRSFLRQFQGKTLKNTLKVGQDIDAVTGATISSKAAAAVVRKALKITEELGR